MTCLLSSKNEFNYPVSKIMHRCAGIHAPENTLAAIKYGYHHHKNQAIEFDVQLTRDNVPVVIHDVELSRTTSGRGIVKNISLSALSSLDAGSWYDKAFYEERIPLFTEVVEYCKSNSIWMNIELKGSDEEMLEHDSEHMFHMGQTVASLANTLFEEHLCEVTLDFKSIPLFSSFSVAALMAAKEYAPRIPRALLVDINYNKTSDLIDVLRRIDCTAVHLCEKDIEEHNIKDIKEAGFKILCYTVNCSKRAAHLRDLGIDAVCTDHFHVSM